MPTTTIFQTTNFDPLTKPQGETVIYDAAGIIDDGPLGNAAQLNYNKETTDAYLEWGFADGGYSWLVFDVDAQFPNATYFWTISRAITYQNQPTQYFIEQGVTGTSGNDVVFDMNGDDIIKTKGGNDLIVSAGGNNAVSAGAGDDIVFVGSGDDVVKAGSGNDQVLARQGNDHVSLGKGDDYIEAGAGDDSVWGGRGEDEIHGDAGADVLHGGRDIDQIYGGDGADWLLGQHGADRLDGGADNDRLTGGGGADTFVFALGTRADVVEDFRKNADGIEIDTALGLLTFADVLNAASQQGGDVVIAAGSDSLTLENTDLSDLSAGQFDFV